jgi:hypothetical protein
MIENSGASSGPLHHVLTRAVHKFHTVGGFARSIDDTQFYGRSRTS